MACIDPDGSLTRKKKSLRCDYHKDHGHEIDSCSSLKFLVEKLIKMGHLRRYIREPDHEVESGQAADRFIVNTTILLESRLAINYILGSPFDDQY